MHYDSESENNDVVRFDIYIFFLFLPFTLWLILDFDKLLLLLWWARWNVWSTSSIPFLSRICVCRLRGWVHGVYIALIVVMFYCCLLCSEHKLDSLLVCNKKMWYDIWCAIFQNVQNFTKSWVFFLPPLFGSGDRTTRNMIRHFLFIV